MMGKDSATALLTNAFSNDKWCLGASDIVALFSGKHLEVKDHDTLQETCIGWQKELHFTTMGQAMEDWIKIDLL